MGDSVEGVRALDVKIAEIEEELERLRQLLADVESNLHVLRKARVLLLGEDGRPREAQPLPEGSGTDEGRPATERSAVDTMPAPLATIILDVMREAGGPLATNELIERLRGRGKDADPATVTNTVAQLVKAGKLWRTAPKTFGLPKGVSL
jgi:hypothetical protein